jgi:hypothetical protein
VPAYDCGQRTITNHDCQSVNSHDSHTQNGRSRGCNRGRGEFRCNTAICCRNARFSAANADRFTNAARQATHNNAINP